MQFKTSTAIAMAAIISQAFSHCVLTSITGANGVTMPGLSVIDGTPRDCSSPGCGSEADTSIIRKNGTPLGKTKGGGDVDAAAAVASFMGTGAASRIKRDLVGKRVVNLGAKLPFMRGKLSRRARGDDSSSSATDAVGTKTPKGTVEDGVAQAAGKGATSGLPTVGADGVLSMTIHQVNQDGAGPMTAAIDPTSGGTDEDAFQPAQMLVDVPGKVAGLSGTTTTDFPVQVQMPAGMTCSGSIAGVQNVCVVRLKNPALAGPFGGSAVFTQDNGAASAAAGGNTTATTAAKRDPRMAFRG